MSEKQEIIATKHDFYPPKINCNYFGKITIKLGGERHGLKLRTQVALLLFLT